MAGGGKSAAGACYGRGEHGPQRPRGPALLRPQLQLKSRRGDQERPRPVRCDAPQPPPPRGISERGSQQSAIRGPPGAAARLPSLECLVLPHELGAGPERPRLAGAPDGRGPAERVEPWGLPRPLPREPGASAGSSGFYRGGAAGRGFPGASQSEGGGGGGESASRGEGCERSVRELARCAWPANVAKQRWPRAGSRNEGDCGGDSCCCPRRPIGTG